MSHVLDLARVDSRVWQEFPDYVAVLLAVSDLQPGPTSAHSDSLLSLAEEQALIALDGGVALDLPEVALWRAAYASFGVKPRDARSSIEALLRRADQGLPRIDRLTDVYNAISIRHRIPIGGENLDAYDGPPQLGYSDGAQIFDTMRDGELVEELVPVGEVVWHDDAGVTCRRWNWRQCVRTRLDEGTIRALFILDGLGVDARHRAERAADELISELRVDSPDLKVEKVVLQIPSA